MLGLALLVLAISESAGAETSVNGTLSDHSSRIYTIDVESTDAPIEVVVTFEGSHADDIDLFLDDPVGVQVSSAESAVSYSETLTHEPRTVGVYRLEVKTYRIHDGEDELDYVLNCSHPLLGIASDLTVEVSDEETTWFYIAPRLDGGPIEVSLEWKRSNLVFNMTVYKNGRAVTEAGFQDDDDDYYGTYEDNATIALNATGLHLVGLYCSDPSWSHPWINRWDRVSVISNTELLLSSFELEEPFPRTGVAWYDIYLDAPGKEMEVSIALDGFGTEVQIYLYNPHGTVVEEGSGSRYDWFKHVGIPGKYALRLSTDRNLTLPHALVSMRSSCPVEAVGTELTELAVADDPMELMLDVRSYNRPLEVVIVWDTNDTVRAELYDPEGYRWWILAGDGPRSRSCYLVDVAGGRHTLKVWVDGGPLVDGVMVNVSSSYHLTTKQPSEEGPDPSSTELLEPILDRLPFLVISMILAVLVIALVMGVRGRARRRSSTSIEMMWRERTSEEAEEGRVGPVEGTGEDRYSLRAYCAFCGHRHETPELTKCTVCGREREEG